MFGIQIYNWWNDLGYFLKYVDKYTVTQFWQMSTILSKQMFLFKLNIWVANWSTWPLISFMLLNYKCSTCTIDPTSTSLTFTIGKAVDPVCTRYEYIWSQNVRPYDMFVKKMSNICQDSSKNFCKFCKVVAKIVIQ